MGENNTHLVRVEICLWVVLYPVVGAELVKEDRVDVDGRVCNNGKVLKPHGITNALRVR